MGTGIPSLMGVKLGSNASGLGLRPRGWLRPSCSGCQGVHPLVKRRPLKVGKLSYAVLGVFKKTAGSRGRSAQR